MKQKRNKSVGLPVWYDRMLSNPLLLVVGIFVVLLASPLLFIYGALLPLFRR